MLHQLMNSLESFVLDAISSLGIWGIFGGMLLESACIPLPSEVIMLFGGFLVGNGDYSFWSVVVAGVSGNLIGSILIYLVGKYGGRPFIEKYGRYVLLNQKHVKQAEMWFEKYGSAAAFFGRILPVIRTFISLPAGMANMKMSKFVIFTFLGCIPWNIILVYLGVKLGENWETGQMYMKPVTYGILAIFILIGIWWMIKRLKSKYKAS
ncbi:DedA family protein [Falsibacillus pallidus]|uniref:DedA family protein n=1 Tax=Falsibacillus pallidus TaxID=493781 RepID=UPI003D953ABC